MPVITGFTTQSPLQSSEFVYITDELNEFGLDNYPYHESELGNVIGSATAGTPPALPASRGITGYRAHRYLDDFYYRVHLIPNPIELGTLLADQTVDVEVWNAWFTGQALSSIDPLNVDGLTLVEPIPPPTTFNPLESRNYQLDISLVGPPEIGATYTFNFAVETPVLEVTGLRATPWPFPPDWSSPVKEKLEWLTDLQTSYNGKEQARSLRTLPRRSYAYNILGITSRLVNALVWKTAGGLYALPLWHDRTVLTADTIIGSNIIYLDTTNRDFYVGGYAIILSTASNYLTVKITAKTDSNLTLVDNIEAVWGANTEVYPLKTSRLQKSQKSAGLNHAIQKLSVKFDCVDYSAWASVDSPTIYRTHPVFEMQHNWKENKTLTIDRKRSVFDSGTGVITYEDEAGIALPSDSFHGLLIGTTAIANFRAWLYARKGKVTPIWSPSQTSDLLIAAPMAAADVNLVINFTEYTSSYNLEINRRDIRIELKDGAIFYRRVNSSSITGGGSTETLILDSSLGIDVAIADVKQISFMMFARLASDNIEFVWLNQQIAKVSITFKGKLYDV